MSFKKGTASVFKSFGAAAAAKPKVLKGKVPTGTQSGKFNARTAGKRRASLLGKEDK